MRVPSWQLFALILFMSTPSQAQTKAEAYAMELEAQSALEAWDSCVFRQALRLASLNESADVLAAGALGLCLGEEQAYAQKVRAMMGDEGKAIAELISDFKTSRRDRVIATILTKKYSLKP